MSLKPKIAELFVESCGREINSGIVPSVKEGFERGFMLGVMYGREEVSNVLFELQDILTDEQFTVYWERIKTLNKKDQ